AFRHGRQNASCWPTVASATRSADRALRRRGRRRKSVEDMGTEPVSRGNVGVLEVRRRITNHAEAFHYLPRPDVVWVGEGNDLVKTDLFESVANRTTRRLGHESIAPVLA